MEEEKAFCEKALGMATRLGAQYADIRYIPFSASESISLKNGVVENLQYSESAGFGVRLLVNGSWGFASSFSISSKEIDRVVRLAVSIAKASSIARQRSAILSPVTTWRDSRYVSPVQTDPFTISQESKIGLLLQADRMMRQQSKKVKTTSCDLFFSKILKLFASTEGASITQEITVSGGGISAKAVEGDEVQIRSYPNSFRGNFATLGYEYIETLDLVKHAPRVAQEAEELLYAPDCPEKETTVILMPGQLCLQIHESVGHPTELDRILGSEITYAGGSFLTPVLQQIGSFRYGSPFVNITADATLKGGLGSYGFDDEGVEAQKFPLIREGVLKNLLTSRETVAEVNERLGREYFKSSNGTMRASFYNRIPLIRMTNICLEPGDWELEDLIASTDEGILLDTNYSWSIDDLRRNFSFGTEAAWLIKNGKRGQLYKNPLYTGITTNFWNSCDAVCNHKYWEMFGTPNCGKGQPGQIMAVGHAASPARFRQVKVGSRKK